MNKKAQSVAEQLANADVGMVHSDTPGVGESLYMTTKGSDIISGLHPVNAWYDEKDQFKYDFLLHNTDVKDTGLYSSVIQCECAHFLN